MALTYEEFKKIVPKETSEFFDILLPYLNKVVGGNLNITFENTKYFADGDEQKCYYLAIYALSCLKEYTAFLGECGFRNYFKDLEEINSMIPPKLDNLYDRYNYLIPQYDDKTLYLGLQPLDIILELQNEYGNILNSYLFSHLFTQTTMAGFRRKITNQIVTKKQLIEKELEKEIFNQVPILVVSYIEVASKIRTLLYNKLQYNKDSICKLIDEDIVPLSLFLAIFLSSTKTQDQSKDNFNDLTAIKYLFEERGIDLNKIRNILNIEIDASDIKNTSKNMYAIKNLYLKYFINDNNINLIPTKNSVQSIVKSILDRGFTNSLVIEKLLSKFNCNIEMFKNIEQETVRALENRRKTIEQENIKKFYKDVPKKTRDFIEFAGKTYVLLLEKMSEKKHNDKILATDNDATLLALYIASHYFNGKISTFFNNSTASFDKVLKLLKINITKEEIESKQIERNTLVQQYRKYVYEGENRNKSSHKITIDDICYNMCNRDFTETMILENIYNSLITEIELPNNFLTLMKEYFIKKENIERLGKTQKLFHDIPVDTIKIVEKASIVYPELIKSNKGIDKRGAQAVSILLSILDLDDHEVKDFLIDKGFSLKAISNYFRIDSHDLFSGDIDIDLLAKDYGLLMFGINNKNKKREEITPFNLIKNIFTKDFNNSSVAFNKFLDHFGFSYDTFIDMDGLYKEYLEKLERDKILKKLNSDISSYPLETRAYMQNVLRIHEKIKRLDNKDMDANMDIESITLLLGVFTNVNEAQKILSRNDVTKENVLSFLKLPDDFLDNLNDIKIDYETYLKQYKKYLIKVDSQPPRYVYNIFKQIFTNNETIKNIALGCGTQYHRLYKEVDTCKSYEDALTINDRMETLDKVKVISLNLDGMQMVLDYGNELYPHSEYIHDELPGMLNTNMDDSITKMSDIIDVLYVPTTSSQKASFFSRIFNSDNVKCTIDKNKLYDLERIIERELEQLKKELLEYDAMRKYIELYSKKNKEYYQETVRMSEKLNERLTTIDSNDEEQYSNYLTTTSFLHIINDKANRFFTVNLIMKKELLKVNQAIVNHFITINSLEMAKDDLLPLIKSEIAISQGSRTEKRALDLSKNIMRLFQALLTRNVDMAMENVSKLQKGCIQEDMVTAINKDINTYLQGINQVKVLEGKIEESDVKVKKIEKKTKQKKDE